MEVNRANREIDEIINNFEKHKLNDLKEIFTNFILISMKYHTKSLEALTASYYDVTNIDESDDLREFQKLMKSKYGTQEALKKTKKSAMDSLRSQSMESLDRDQLLSPLKRTNKKLSKSTKNLNENNRDDDAKGDKKTLGNESESYDDEEDDDEEGEGEVIIKKKKKTRNRRWTSFCWFSIGNFFLSNKSSTQLLFLPFSI